MAREPIGHLECLKKYCSHTERGFENALTVSNSMYIICDRHHHD